MLIDTHIGGLETSADQAAAAEAAGYAGVFTGEVSGDPFLPLAVAAGRTERIELGTSIAVALARSPMSLAYIANDLQRFSHGRFSLGLGSQVKAHITRRFSMPWGQPAAQMREFVLALRAIWRSWSDGEPLAFEGTYYRHSLMTPMFTPARHEFGTPPVLVAGVGEAMTRIAGEVADGFLCHAFTTERWVRERTLPALQAGFARAGRSSEGFIVKAPIFLATGTDAEIDQAVAGIRPHLAFYASTPAYRPVLELHGWEEIGDRLAVLARENKWPDMAALIHDDMLNAFAIVAPPDEIGTRVAARCHGAVDRVSFVTSTPPEQLIEIVNG
jgi:probable F420-dependent oxidoreductase